LLWYRGNRSLPRKMPALPGRKEKKERFLRSESKKKKIRLLGQFRMVSKGVASAKARGRGISPP